MSCSVSSPSRGLAGRRHGPAFAAACGLALVASALVTPGCGGGGGGGGGGFDAGPEFWGVPFTTPYASSSHRVTLQNLRRQTTTATLTSYAYDGSIVGGAAIMLDAFRPETVEFGGTLGIAWTLVTTPSGGVEVCFAHVDAAGPVDEAHRGFPLPDLGAPPPLTTQVLPVVLPATSLRISNATGAPSVVTVDAFATPTPGQQATLSASTAVPLGAFATTVLDPGTLVANFAGQLRLSSTSPFFAATTEGGFDFGFAGGPPVSRRDRVLHTDVAFGLEHASPIGYTDFALVLSNTSDEARDVVLREVRRPDGSPLKLAPRTIGLGGRETRSVSTLDAPLVDLFGDALLAAGLTRARLELFVPRDVDVAARQFDPVSLVHLGTRPFGTAGHVVDVLQLERNETPTTLRQFVTVHNPSATPLTVTVSSLVPQPPGFDTGALPLTTLTVPARGFLDYSPDGTAFLDRDGLPVDFFGLRVTCPVSFALTARRERRAGNGLLLMISPTIVRSHDDGY